MSADHVRPRWLVQWHPTWLRLCRLVGVGRWQAQRGRYDVLAIRVGGVGIARMTPTDPRGDPT